jgi:hypothetical protein
MAVYILLAITFIALLFVLRGFVCFLAILFGIAAVLFLAGLLAPSIGVAVILVFFLGMYAGGYY